MIYVSGAALRALQEMVAAEKADKLEDAEIACDRLECWIGTRRTSWAVVYKLLRLGALADVSDSKGCSRFGLNDDGRRLAADQTYETRITEAQRTGAPVTR